MSERRVRRGWCRGAGILAGLMIPLAALSVQPEGVGTYTRAAAVDAWGQGQPGVDYVADEVLVEFETTASAQSSLDTVHARRDRVRATLSGRPAMARVALESGHSVAEAVRAYAADPRVKHVQPNFIYRATAVPNDPEFADHWGLDNRGQTVDGKVGTAGLDIGAPEAWDLITDCRDTVVAVIDTGANYTHADLADNMWDGGADSPNHGWDFVDDDNDPMPYGGAFHGTHVAGTIAAVGDNATAGTGVCWRASIMTVRVLGANNSGTTGDIIEGIDYAVENGARVINMSLGGPGLDPLYEDSLDNARENDVLVVVAAGNSSKDVDRDAEPTAPCSFDLDNIICVAALDSNYALASFSNFGDEAVDVGAPGTSILSAFPGPQEEFDYSTWNLDPSWGEDTCVVSPGGSPQYGLFNPADWCTSGSSPNNLEARAYNIFDLSDSMGGGYGFLAFGRLGSADDALVSAHVAGLTGDPFDIVQDASQADAIRSGEFTSPPPWQASAGAADCAGQQCSVGLMMITDGTGPDSGIAVVRGYFQHVIDGAADVSFLQGTSMASPHVAGIAALVRSAVPDKTYAEIRDAILTSGDLVGALDGITTTGREADAFAAIRAANDPPTAADASAETEAGKSVDIAISASDPNGHELGFALDEAPAHGAVTFDGGTARYTPVDGFTGADAFTVTVDDGFTGTATASVEVTVTAKSDDDGGSSGGCTLGGPGRPDPLLPGLALLALAVAGARRRRY